MEVVRAIASALGINLGKRCKRCGTITKRGNTSQNGRYKGGWLCLPCLRNTAVGPSELKEFDNGT